MSNSNPPADHVFGKSLRTLEVDSRDLDSLYQDGYCDLYCDEDLWPNQPLVLRCGPHKCGLGLVGANGVTVRRVSEDTSFFRISGRNKEQMMLLNLLQDPTIRVVVITGAAGTGKTLLVSAYAMHKVLEVKEWERLLLSKPLEVTTSTRYWGTVPGDANEKFAPFLRSYLMTFENIIGKGGVQYIQSAKEQGVIEFFPLELMRGVSIQSSIVWYDEVQNLNQHEMQTLGSRIDDVGRSKIILSGDFQQIDKRLSKDKTGLLKLVESPEFLRSPLTAHVHLTKIERGAVAQLFHDVFEDE